MRKNEERNNAQSSKKNERENRKTVPGKLHFGYMILNRPYF